MSRCSLHRSNGMFLGTLSRYNPMTVLKFRAVRAYHSLIRTIRSVHTSSPRLASGIEEDEKLKFTRFAPHWWDPQGNVRVLHSLNQLRVPFIRDGLCHPGAPMDLSPDSYAPLTGLHILDVGCGGGILSEPLAVLGASVLGIDQVEESITVATEHANHTARYKPSPAFHPPKYRLGTLQEIAHESPELFDAVVLSEVLEHVTEWEELLRQAALCLKPGGMLFLTTINRTPSSFLFAIVGAEYLTRIIPLGTHQWSKFIEPDRVYAAVTKFGLQTQQLLGMLYNPFTDRWSWSNYFGVWYAMSAAKTVRS